jgi:hypothetical protein
VDLQLLPRESLEVRTRHIPRLAPRPIVQGRRRLRLESDGSRRPCNPADFADQLVFRLDQPDRFNIIDGLNEEPVLVLSESSCADSETQHAVSSRISDSLHPAPEKDNSVSVHAESPPAVFSRVVQDHFTRLQYLCSMLSVVVIEVCPRRLATPSKASLSLSLRTKPRKVVAEMDSIPSENSPPIR